MIGKVMLRDHSTTIWNDVLSDRANISSKASTQASIHSCYLLEALSPVVRPCFNRPIFLRSGSLIAMLTP